MSAHGFSDLIDAARAGWSELLAGGLHWRIWHLLGTKELRNRYTRSCLGQFWLTLSSAIMIGGMGLLWSVLFNQPVHELLPFFGIGLIIWNFLSQVLLECTGIFAIHGPYYRNQKMNYSVSIYSVIYKNAIIIAYNFVIVVILIVTFAVPVNWYLLQIVPAILVTWLTLLWSGYILAMACARYRDLIQVVTNWLSFLFFFSPIIWQPKFLPEKYHWILDLNPFALFLELLRNPFLGKPISSYTWFVTIAIAFGGGVLALPVIGQYWRRVIFWM